MTSPTLSSPTGTHRPATDSTCTCGDPFPDSRALGRHIAQAERWWRMRRNEMLQTEPDGRFVPRTLLTELLLAAPEPLREKAIRELRVDWLDTEVAP